MNKDGKISKPISITDLKTVLSTNSNVLSTNCKSSSINKWSRDKPMRYSKNYELTEAEKFLANYGLDVNSAITFTSADLISKATNDSGWAYLTPRGGSSEPYRMSDFNNYNHNAKPMFLYDSLPSQLPTISTSASIELLFKRNTAAELKLTDFVEFSDSGNIDMYHYAVAYYTTESNLRIAHGPKVSEVTGNDIYINVTFPMLGVWKCIFMITMETGSTPVGNHSVYIPGGTFEVNVYRLYRYAYVTITNDFSNMWMDDNGIYGFYIPTISIVDDGSTFPSSNGRLALTVYCYAPDDDRAPIYSFNVIDESNAEFNYAGTGTKTYTLDFLSGLGILFSIFAPDLNVSMVGKVKIEAWI